MKDGKSRNLFLILNMSFAVLLVLSNTIANRLFEVGGILLPSAVIVFPATYIIGDVVTELFGFNATRRMIIISLLLNCVFVGGGIVSTLLPAPVSSDNIAAYNTVFNVAPKTAIASTLGFFFGSIVNAFIMAKMKKSTVVNKHLILRVLSSTVIGEFVDTCFFISIVFIGTLDLKTILIMIVSQFAFKVVYEALFSPITILLIRKLSATLNKTSTMSKE